jgi:periplasmic protein TonB
MSPKTEESLYFETLTRRNAMGWLGAAAAALALNLVFFAAMPFLLHTAPSKPAFEEIVSRVNVIRLHREDTPVKRKTETPPEPPPERKQPRPAINRPIRAALSLPFELNPRLPASPGALSLPPLPPAAFAGAGNDNTFTAGDLDFPLTALARIPPVYPIQAKYRGIEGWARVRFLVREDGTVGSVTVVESKPPGVFDDCVIRCVSGWRFKPGTVDGMAVKALAETTIRFQLE